jgi:hypothetical protein
MSPSRKEQKVEQLLKMSAKELSRLEAKRLKQKEAAELLSVSER